MKVRDRLSSYNRSGFMLASIVYLFMQVIIFQACQKEDGIASPILEISEDKKDVVFLPNSSSSSIAVSTNADDLEIISSTEWCTASFLQKQKKIQINVIENASLEMREAVISIRHSNISQKVNVTQFGVKPAIIMYSDTIVTDFKSKVISTEVYSNVDLTIESNSSWIHEVTNLKSVYLDPVKYSFSFNIDKLTGEELVREGLIVLKQTEGALKDTIVVAQQLTDKDSYLPGETQSFEKDKKISIISGRLTPADKFQSGREFSKSYDGDLSTLYHSPWSGMPEQPVITLEYNLDPEEAKILNYVVLYPTPSGSNGIIKTATMWVTTKDNSVYTKIADINAVRSNTPLVIMLDNPIIDPRFVKLEVTDAYSHDEGKYYVSLVEIECYESTSINSLENDLSFFTDNTFSELKAGVGLDDVLNIENPFIQNIAAYLLTGKYNTEFRVQEFEPFRPVSDLSRELKTSGYSAFENPTGIYFKENEEVIVFVGQGDFENLALRVKDFGNSLQDNSYVLKEGVNVITMKGKGNGYISYYTDQWESLSPVKIHIASGQVNGYFDVTRHTNEDGSKILENATSTILDIKGERVQLAYSVNELKQYAQNGLHNLTVIYDSIVSSQQTLMGLQKYGRLPKNHMLGRVIWDGFMHADGTGAAFHVNTLSYIADPNRLPGDIWGPAHEFGHVNQVRPGMKWVGTSECTNNLYSAWIQYCYTPHKLRLEHEEVNGETGGRYNGYFQNGLINGQEWGLQVIKEEDYGVKDNGKWGGDHFVKLIPLWQLQLYYHVAGEGNSWYRPYFYADIFEKVRNTDESSLSHGQLQINFVKNTCDAVQQDLSDFFIKTGMLKAVDKYFDDYSSAQKTITQAMIDEAVNYASQYPKPETNVIYYISGNSIDAFKNKRSVVGQYNSGLVGTTSKKIVHSAWQNVVVFETYTGDSLTDITLVGTGSSSNDFTNVPYPSGSTRIEAVAYDGTRVLVCGSR